MAEKPLEEIIKVLREAIQNKEPNEKVKSHYEEYVERYRMIKIPKVMHMLEFRDLFFKYHDYIKKKKEHK